jgi:hypothetical protein
MLDGPLAVNLDANRVLSDGAPDLNKRLRSTNPRKLRSGVALCPA